MREPKHAVGLITPQDEKAFMLIDELFKGRAREVGEVEQAFARAKLPAWRQYLTMQGVHITKDRISDKYWAYKWDAQKLRLENDEYAMRVVSDVMFQYKNWEDVPAKVFDKHFIAYRGMRSRIDEALKVFWVYRDDESWKREDTVGPWRVCGWELSREDRNWIFKELEVFVEMYDMELGDVDGERIWEDNKSILKDSADKNQFMRCVEIANLHESTSVKDIFGVESTYG